MKKLTTIFLAAIMTMLLLASCANPDEFSDDEKLSQKYSRTEAADVTYNYADGVTEPPQAHNAYANLITGFELKYFRARFQNSAESFVISPVSTVLQLSLLANGASGDTRQEFLTALGGTTLDNVNACSSYLKSRLEYVSRMGLSKEDSPEEYVLLDGAFFLNNGNDVKSSFLQADADYYGYDVFRYDFTGENAAKKLKNYLADYTEEALPAQDGNSGFFTVSASAVIDNWLEPYTNSGAMGVFQSVDGEQKLRYLTSNESVLKSNKAVGIVKYTEKNPLKLIIAMPNEDITLEDYVKDFTNEEYAKLIDSLDITQKDTVAIPEFSTPASQKATALSDTLKRCGLYSLFTDNAKFDSLSFSENLGITEMYELEPAFSLTENGINKANSNALMPVQDTAETLNADADTVVFNRPFLFILADNETNIPVYIGVYR